MVWKKVNNSDAGDATHHGGNSMDKVSDLFSGVDIDTVDMNSDWKFRNGRHQQSNPANTFKYIHIPSAILGNRNVTWPLLTGDDTVVFGSMTNTFSALNTFTVGQKMDSYVDLKAIAEPASPTSGYIRLFIDTVDGKTKIKRSNGDVVIIE